MWYKINFSFRKLSFWPRKCGFFNQTYLPVAVWHWLVVYQPSVRVHKRLENNDCLWRQNYRRVGYAACLKPNQHTGELEEFFLTNKTSPKYYLLPRNVGFVPQILNVVDEQRWVCSVCNHPLYIWKHYTICHSGILGMFMVYEAPKRFYSYYKPAEC